MSSSWAEKLHPMVPIHISIDGRNKVYCYDYPTKYGSRVFIKQVKCETEEDMTKATNEAEISHNNPHPNLCDCLGWEQEPPFVYIFSEVMESSLFQDLTARYSSDPPRSYTEEELGYLAKELVTGFAYLQTIGIAHRDVKPHNILLGSDGKVKICDFGFAKKIETSQNTLLGTIPYFSPKLKHAFIQGETQVLKVQHNAYKSDVFSLGVVFAHLMFREIPLIFSSLKGLQANIDEKLSHVAGFSPYWIEFLRWMLRVEEEYRPDFLELKQALTAPALPYADDQYIGEIAPFEAVEDPLQLMLKCGLQQVRVSPASLEVVPCMLSIEAMKLGEVQRMEPIDLICVIDESGSMGGELMELMKHTLSCLVDQLGDTDRLCIIGFSDIAERKCPLICCTEKGKAMLKACITTLDAIDNTNITAGLQVALEVLSQRRVRNSSAAILLFTDGKDNISANTAEACISALEQQHVQKLSVHCFGYGIDLDTQLLEQIAGHGGGVFTHVNSLEDIPKAFAYSFGGLTSVIARNIHVEVVAKPGKVPCAIEKMYSKDGLSSFNLSDISAGQRKDLIFFIKPPVMELRAPTQLTVAEAIISYVANDGTESTKEVALSMKFVKWSDARSPMDKEVFTNWYRVKGADSLRVARELANSKQFREADKRLEQAIDDLGSSGYANCTMVADVLRDLEVAKALVQSDTTWERGGGDAHFASVSYSHMTQTASVIASRYASVQQEQVAGKMRSQLSTIPEDKAELNLIQTS